MGVGPDARRTDSAADARAGRWAATARPATVRYFGSRLAVAGWHVGTLSAHPAPPAAHPVHLKTSMRTGYWSSIQNRRARGQNRAKTVRRAPHTHAPPTKSFTVLALVRFWRRAFRWRNSHAPYTMIVGTRVQSLYEVPLVQFPAVIKGCQVYAADGRGDGYQRIKVALGTGTVLACTGTVACRNYAPERVAVI
jgi:hypothetical protein